MLPAISFVSAAILAYEVLLMRLFAIVQWHHFAYMVISIALLGFGASGSFLALAQGWLKPRFVAGFAVNAILFGVSALAAFALGERVPFNALEVLWNAGQLLYLFVLYLLFTVPFFCGANCIGLAFACFGAQIGRIYRYDLMGAGLGALGIVAILFLGRGAGVLCEERCSPAPGRRWIAGRGRPSADARAAVLDRLAVLRIQGVEYGIAGSGHRGDRRVVQPAGSADGGPQPDDSLPACPGTEPRQHDRAAGAARRVHRRRRAQRHHQV